MFEFVNPLFILFWIDLYISWCYNAGQNKRTDWFIDHLYTPKGFFTQPFDTVTSLYQRLSKLYESVELEAMESMACFTCRKGE